jgi:L-ascorbate metabolism protein UlaG (beta-lactamase superfamily)
VQIRWFGQSAFLITAREGRVFLDPFHVDQAWLARSGRSFDYPPIEGVEAELLLITHEHPDHNAAEAVSGSPKVIRSTAGTFETPLGTVLAVASEHDDVAGTRRGPNAIFAFTLEGLRLAHFGDFGQRALRPEQAEALGAVDIAFLPVGGGPTIDGRQAAAIADALPARIVIPMHYRTPALDWLDPVDVFVDAMGGAKTYPTSHVDTGELPARGAVVLAAPRR